MTRLSPRQYQRHGMLAMAIYVGFMLLAWPTVRATASLPLKALLALVPVLPMLYVIGLMARRIAHSDELEQRMHLVALGAATVVVGSLSLVGGFLAAAGVWRTDGAILIWVFPALMVSYGVTRWWVGRRYGMEIGCEDARGTSMPLRFLLGGMAAATAAWMGWGKLDDTALGVLCGMSASFVLIAAALVVTRWLARRAPAAER